MASASMGEEPKHSSASRVVHHRPASGVQAGIDHNRNAGELVERAGCARPAARRGSTVWTRAVPSTCTAAGIARASAVLLCVNKHVRAGKSSRRRNIRGVVTSTIGATGRNCSRPLMLLSRSRFSGIPGLAIRLRCPSARGPNSLRPWNQPTTPSSARICATALAISAGRSYSTFARLSHAASRSRRPFAAERGGAHRLHAIAVFVRGEKCGAKRCARVARRGLNPHALEGTFARDARVGDAVERDAAGHRQIPVARFCGAATGNIQKHFL